MTKARHIDAKERATTRNFLSLVALGSGLAATPAAALELGDVAVQSSLGQPLRASIAYALAPNEMLSSTCVSVSGRQSTGGLPGIGSSTVRITDRAIIITGSAAVSEPMLGARVTVNCPYTPNLSREYMLFVDPAPVADGRPAAQAVARPETAPAQQPVAVERPANRAPVNDTPIGQSSDYQVQPGDTLSSIAGRIENRTMSLWPAVNAIFAANPDAFIGNDPNKLKAGARLTIPSLDGTPPVVAASDDTSAAPAITVTPDVATPATTVTPDVATPATTVTPDVATPATTVTPDVATPATTVTPVIDVPVEATTAPAAVTPTVATTPASATIDAPQETGAGDTTADLKPGASPELATAVISTGARSESTSLLAWLLAGGLAAIGALVMFGRRWRKGSDAAPSIAATAGPVASADADSESFTDYDIDDDSPTAENLALDADLGLGTGFDEDGDMEVGEADFGFAATTDLDIELPFEPEPTIDANTDIIPPANMKIESILESEVLPDDEDYDMSVIIDATKMPQPEEVTECDLKAVEVGAGDDSAIANNYTISHEADYDILEQDYEDELTATQALNLEIERAAAELAKDVNETADDEETSALPAASYDPDDTSAVTMNMSRDDETAEMHVANDDETTEMEIESGTFDTKRMG